MSLRGTVRRIAVTGAIGFAFMAAPPALAGSGAAADDAAAAAAQDGLLHDWRATLRYGRNSAPLEDDLGAHIGDGDASRITMGLDVRVGARGFARIHAGRGWRDGAQAFEFEDMAGDADSAFVGITGGAFLLPYLAVGLSLEYSDEDGADEFTNRFFPVTTPVDHKTRSWYAAPFAMLTAPVGPVDLSLLASYLRQRSSAEYSVPSLPWLDSTDSGRLDLALAELSAGLWALRDLRLGASVGWTKVLSQRTPGAELPLDEHWGTLGLNAAYRLTDAVDVSIDASHDVGNARGDGYSWGIGLAYRF